jgi:hypothetical protein
MQEEIIRVFYGGGVNLGSFNFDLLSRHSSTVPQRLYFVVFYSTLLNNSGLLQSPYYGCKCSSRRTGSSLHMYIYMP